MAQTEITTSDPLASVRETVESVFIAIVLAFVLRAFVVEAFVIPTGSMAPRLMGQHRQFDCPACGYHYAFGLHAPEGEDNRRRGGGVPTCPNCGHLNRPRHGLPAPYSGDRVLVLKYLYRLREPRPWDVVVFKNPLDNQQNYIKRLIGLPGQAVEIVHGDVFVCHGEDVNGDRVIDEMDFLDFNGDGRLDRGDLDRNGDGAVDDADFALSRDDRRRLGLGPGQRLTEADLDVAEPHGVIDRRDVVKLSYLLLRRRRWEILRKPHRTQEVMWQVVFNNDYQPTDAQYEDETGPGWTSPWIDLGSRWSLTDRGRRVFGFKGAEAPQSVRFDGKGRRDWFLPNYAYNQADLSRFSKHRDICYDLKLGFLFVPAADDARVGLRLSSFDHHFRAWVGADGTCTLEHGVASSDGGIAWGRRQEARVRMSEKRGHEVALTHVERRATLWVDGRDVLATDEARYGADKAEILAAVERKLRAAPDGGLAAPAAEVLGDGGRFELWHVRLMRDVYYTNMKQDAGEPGHGTTGKPIILRRFLDDPDRDEFFVLGDNSPQSKDSRMWDQGAPTLRPGYREGTVPRYGMIGKAFFVYWPGGYRLPWARLPIVPNVGRMRLIR